MKEYYKYISMKRFLLLLLIVCVTSCTPSSSLVSGNYMLSSSAGNEGFSKNYIGRAAKPTVKQKGKVTRPGSSILFVEFTAPSNRILWDGSPVAVIPDDKTNKSYVNLLNKALANLDASSAQGIPIKGEISLEKIASVKFTVDSIHKFLSITPNSDYDYSRICASSMGIYNGKLNKASKDQLNYIQKIFQISGKFELKAKEAYKAAIQAEIEKLPVEAKANWSKVTDDVFEYELKESWAVVEVVALPNNICNQVSGQLVNNKGIGLLKKKN